MLRIMTMWASSLVLLTTIAGLQQETTYGVEISDGASIQQAIDEVPGGVVHIPPGDYEISEPIVISNDGAVLQGPARIIQTNPEAVGIVIRECDDVQIRNLTVTRPDGSRGANAGVEAVAGDGLIIDDVRVVDNKGAPPSLILRRCTNSRITNCLVRNYTGIAVDDRTRNENYGFAFRCFAGTGIQLADCRQCLLQNNRVLELDFLPTREMKEELGMGEFTAKNPTKGRFVSQETWDAETFPQWIQGAAIDVGGPKQTDQIQIVGNYIENSAQALDIHGDRVTVSGNIVNNAAVGIKAMHGSRNTLILGNQLIKCDAHAILLQPGAISHEAGNPVNPVGDIAGESLEANIDGASIIANNIVSDFGYGHAHWIWGNERDVICLEPGQLPENPPLTDVVVQGNVVYDPGRDKIIVAGEAVEQPPRYRFALLISNDSPTVKGPQSVKVFGNILHPGSGGVCNRPLEQW